MSAPVTISCVALIEKKGVGWWGLGLVKIQNLPSHACPLSLVREQRELIISLQPLLSPRLHQDMNGHRSDCCVHSQDGQTGPRRGGLEERPCDQSGRKTGLFSMVSFLTAGFVQKKLFRSFFALKTPVLHYRYPLELAC